MESKTPLSFDGYERWFWRVKLLLYSGIGLTFDWLLTAIGHWRLVLPNASHPEFFKAYPVTAWTMLIFCNFGAALLAASYRSLNELYDEFTRRPEIQDSAILLRNLTGQAPALPTLSRFVLSRNLREFQGGILSIYHRLKENALNTKRIEQSIRTAQLEAQQMEDLKQRFALAVEVLTTEAELDRYQSSFAAAKNLEEARAIIRDLEIRAAKRDATQQGQIAKRDRLEIMLSELAQDGELCDEANALLQESTKTPYVRQAIRSLTAAITAQKSYNKRHANTDQIPDPKPVVVQQPPAAPATIAMQEAFPKLFPAGVDQEMATQTLAVLIQEGCESYNELRLRTANLYRTDLGRPFPTRSFDETLTWLTGDRIVTMKMEGRDLIYSLSQRPSDCPSKSASAIVRRAMEIERSLPRARK